MSEMREIQVLKRLAEVLDALGIPYAIGGSIASSMYGTVRFTRDADIGIYPFPSVANKFYEMLKDEFYVNEQAMQEALSCCGSFNIVHFETAFKIDLFLLGPSDFEQQLVVRSKVVRLGESPESDLCFVSPEDVILLKLRRLNESDGFSENQWDDILGVLAVQGRALKFEYLNDYARVLGVEQLLERAIAEAATYV
ncbi:MAG: nucleotidyltransferase [Phycisphaerales bacterium]|nr:MAG: nucleotidyltransferase [Phycisphaerales bacterium]